MSCSFFQGDCPVREHHNQKGDCSSKIALRAKIGACAHLSSIYTSAFHCSMLYISLVHHFKKICAMIYNCGYPEYKIADKLKIRANIDPGIL